MSRTVIIEAATPAVELSIRIRFYSYYIPRKRTTRHQILDRSSVQGISRENIRDIFNG